MSAPTRTGPAARPALDDPVRRLARAVLTLAVRGRRERGGGWGEAVLSEFAETRGRWEALRWAAGGVRVALRERRARRRELPRWVRVSRRFVLAALIGGLASLAVQQWVVTPMYLPSGPMEPTLMVADRWLMDRVGFRVTGLGYGDVVAFEHSGVDGQQVTYVRRVVGLAGDRIECRDGHVLRNGSLLHEPYLSPDSQEARTDCPVLVVPSGSVFVLGDHRSVAAPVGLVPVSRIEGRMICRLWNAQ